MASKWVQCTTTDEISVVINLDSVAHMLEFEEFTRIIFVGLPEKSVEVEQTAPQILAGHDISTA